LDVISLAALGIVVIVSASI